MTVFKLYRAIFPDDDYTFEMGHVGSDGRVGVASIVGMAKYMKSQLTKNDQVGIDFTPFHDVEHIPGLSLRRCVPLSQDEQDLFWQLLAS